MFSKSVRTPFVVAAVAAIAMACGDDTITEVAPGFLGGTSTNHEIGLVVNSTGKAVTLFQLGSPTTTKQIPLGTSSTITPVGASVKKRLAAVPLGNAASVALIDLETQTIKRFYTFASGNATGSAWSDDTTLFVANVNTGVVGRVTVGQASDAITTTTVQLAAQPTAISFTGGRILVTSTNLDANFAPIGNGVVTAIDPKTMAVLGTATTGGTNSSDAAVGPDGNLYVVNTEDFAAPGSLTIINPATMAVVTTVTGFGVGPGAISIDANGLAYVSGFFFGTLVWDTRTRTFVRGLANPVCAKVGTTCRGAFAATTNAAGDLYQLFFGSAAQNQPPYVFVFKGSAYTLSDSIAAGTGPAAINIRTY